MADSTTVHAWMAAQAPRRGINHLVEALGTAEVLLHRDEEAAVARELGHVAFRRLVELLVVLDHGEEARHPAAARKGRHLEEDLPGVVATGDRLERFEILEPRFDHRRCNDRAAGMGTGETGPSSQGSLSRPAAPIPRTGSPPLRNGNRRQRHLSRARAG